MPARRRQHETLTRLLPPYYRRPRAGLEPERTRKASISTSNAVITLAGTSQSGTGASENFVAQKTEAWIVRLPVLKSNTLVIASYIGTLCLVVTSHRVLVTPDDQIIIIE